MKNYKTQRRKCPGPKVKLRVCRCDIKNKNIKRKN